LISKSGSAPILAQLHKNATNSLSLKLSRTMIFITTNTNGKKPEILRLIFHTFVSSHRVHNDRTNGTNSKSPEKRK
jgi:hypothetical protein